MKKIISIITFTLLLVVLVVIYSIFMLGIAQLAPNNGKGEILLANGKEVGYQKIGQKFNKEQYFWGRPSTVEYNAAGSAGSNKGPSNEEYLTLVQKRIDTFLIKHPYLKKSDISSEMITASGSGLDPNISPKGAYVQVKRIAEVRKLDENKVNELVKKMIKKPIVIGVEHVNVLELNIALDQLK